jgi:hypothetical protein
MLEGRLIFASEQPQPLPTNGAYLNPRVQRSIPRRPAARVGERLPGSVCQVLSANHRAQRDAGACCGTSLSAHVTSGTPN